MREARGILVACPLTRISGGGQDYADLRGNNSTGSESGEIRLHGRYELNFYSFGQVTRDVLVFVSSRSRVGVYHLCLKEAGSAE